jgi:hypothetical protein
MPPTALNYLYWPGTSWRVDTNPGGTTSNVDIGDTFSFTLGATPITRLTGLSCAHGGTHNAGNWTGVCTGSGTMVVGITSGGKVFKIVCTVEGQKHKLTCSVLCDCGQEAPGGGVCWTATDG